MHGGQGSTVSEGFTFFQGASGFAWFEKRVFNLITRYILEAGGQVESDTLQCTSDCKATAENRLVCMVDNRQSGIGEVQSEDDDTLASTDIGKNIEEA